MQRMRLVLEPRHHQIHHTEPFETHYCITNGWLNPLLNKVGFFRGMETGLRFVGIEIATREERVAEPFVTKEDAQLSR